MATLTDEQRQGFRDNGFLIYGPLLDTADAETIGQRIDALAAGEGSDAGRVGIRLEPNAAELDGVARRDKAWQLMNVAKADQVIAEVTRRPDILELVGELLQTGEVSFLQDQVLMKPAFHGSEVSWHQDSAYWTQVEPRVDPPAIVTCWVAIDNVTEDNGCVKMVPGSHKNGVLPHAVGGNNLLHVEGVDLESAVPVVLPPGGVSFHHSCTVHGSAPNRTADRRRGVALTYVRDDARPSG
ncbi:MAG TPA: phytanoyl-CoA dioxygenase family protein [Mycobacteriales bacterium]|jgi:ectoine hydroxylase-related dioxygenase (phytanoyl-CoA dioxygenase family)|nr:phytanoyl-CoA dioxygenase family protein [Mycobacteriales bacterium]